MNRLLQEFDRLYAALPTDPAAAGALAPPVAGGADAAAAAGRVDAAGAGPTAAVPLLDATGRTRALVLALHGPPEWAPLVRVWGGVQADLGWPAPAIAVSGDDALQLWFSLAEPVSPSRAQALLQALRARYLAAIEPARVTVWPAAADADGACAAHAPPVPAPAARGDDRWSAFVAADLAPLFAEAPWLDGAPGDDGQARLLAGLRSIAAEEVARLPAGRDGAGRAAAAGAATSTTPGAAASRTAGRGDAAPADRARGIAADEGEAPVAPFADDLPAAAQAGRREALAFLRTVLRDASLPLAHRLDAAAVLLSARPARRHRDG